MIPRSMLRRLLSLAALTPACVSEQVLAPTQVVVVVESDAPAGSFTRLEASIQSEDGARMIDQPLAFALDQGTPSYTLPLSFGVVQPKAGAEAFRLVVTGYDSQAVVVERKSIVHFEPHSTLRVKVRLEASCLRELCTNENETCSGVASSSVPGSRCGPIADAPSEAIVPGEELADVLGGADASVRRYDAGDGSAPTDDPDAERPSAEAGATDAAATAADSGDTDSGAPPPSCPTAACEPGGTCAGEDRCVCAVGYLGSGTAACRAFDSALAGGIYHTCAARADGKVSCWGSIKPAYSSSPVNDLVNVVELVTGEDYACARTAVDVLCWGKNDAGQLGTGDRVDSRTPRRVEGLTGVTSMAANWFRTCALDASQHVLCWGGAYGESEHVLSPRMVALEGAAKVAVGTGHTCALKADATVWCWGANDGGQLGNGMRSESPSLTPTQVLGLGPVKEIALGGGTSCALQQDGKLLCWGHSVYRDADSANIVDIQSPVPVAKQAPAGLHGMRVGSNHLCGIDAEGHAVCRGRGGAGQLGAGKFESSPDHFVSVIGLTQTVKEVAAGSNHSCARLLDDTVWCWGWSTDGQLGDGAATDGTAPDLALPIQATAL
ncbi:MAG TPA: hypothetical protein VFX59_10830 [Polyangiales bacterium]|nr:hypothetical protein [Polyangiales bacterium]